MWLRQLASLFGTRCFVGVPVGDALDGISGLPLGSALDGLGSLPIGSALNGYDTACRPTQR
jgi:hypothetical protein